jgi:serine/threonine protein phosphatase PrpC
MGGHANGQDASRLAIQTIINYILPKISANNQMDDVAFLNLLRDGVQCANQAVHQRNLEERADMGTTMTAAMVVGPTAYVANVGDSRTYLYHEPEGLSMITHDHSVVASLVDAGIIKPDDIYTHPKRNQIYRSLGEKPAVDVDSFRVPLQVGEKLLLCSDGLWDMVRDPEIQRLMSAPVPDPAKTSKYLIQAALGGGGEDNVSVIVVSFSEAEIPTSSQASMTGVQLLYKPETVTVPDLPQM